VATRVRARTLEYDCAGTEAAVPPLPLIEVPDQDQESVSGGAYVSGQAGDLVPKKFGFFVGSWGFDGVASCR
jgi:hypothetical protein